MAEEKESLSDKGILFVPSEIDEGEGEKFAREALNIANNEVLNIVYVYINSYGGYCGERQQITDSIKYLKTCGKKIITICSGYAFSAAFNIFITGDERRITKHSILMSHRYTGGFYGKYPDIIAGRKYEDWIHEVNIKHCMECLGWSRKKVEKTLLTMDDKWFTPKESLELGIATEII